MKNKKKIYIFTDLDGTILNSKSFNFKRIIPFIKKCHQNGIIIIPISSKTKIEIENFFKKLKIKLAFACENGSAIYNLNLINKDFPKEIILGISIEKVEKKFREEIKSLNKHNFDFVSKISLKEKHKVLGIPNKDIKYALKRSFSILINYKGINKDKKKFINYFKNKKIKILEGGRVLQLSGNVNKSKAIKKILKLVKNNKDIIYTIGVGDNKNDIDMLETSDIGCLVLNKSFDNNIPKDKFIISKNIAPDGWVEVVKIALKKIGFELNK